MRKWVRVTAWATAALLLVAGGGVLAGLQLAERRMHRQVEVKALPVAYVSDPQALERGRYLFASRGCVDCHGANGAGRTFVDDAAAGVRIKGPNISPGPGSLVARYQPEDWVRAIRHGVAPGGRPLMIMPSEDYNRFTDADLAALVAYVRSLPPAAGGAAIVELPLPARVLYGFGAIEDAAAKIDHARPPATAVAEGVTVQHGAYVANMCLGCHGAQLAGGRIPGSPPDWPPASRLAPGNGSVMDRYPDAESLIRLFRTGRRADGSAVKVMPFDSLREINDTDMRALHLYLRSLSAPARG
ncbi:cytochrome c [Ramlibacter tataouinensis]|uniref:c-type cytochrome n=1 Tax=Ramlibacter tataouinensis TaxID=94132 RepID=UPI0022F39C31|nr:cytochrome c [Ramlibacter tataouinensis]WBY03319.1 cytochrome c [Ramlibacter tataouinensis]